MKTEKGFFWASDYWSQNVYQQAANTLNSSDDNPYGNKGDANWQIIALSEGWANYREWYLATTKLVSYPALSTTKFPEKYGYMFDDLKNIGCSFANLEKSLCTYSVGDFKSKLINYHPTLKTQIETIILPYE